MAYRNKFEEKVAKQLGPEWEYEKVRLPYVIRHKYLADFAIEGDKLITEAKGRFTDADRRKHKAIKEQHPDWHVTIVFQNPDRPTKKGSKLTYGGWCDKNGIAWRKA